MVVVSRKVLILLFRGVGVALFPTVMYALLSAPLVKRVLPSTSRAFGVVVAAQAPAPTYKAPRTAAGQPDFQGIWQVWNTAKYNVEPHSASLGITAGFGFVVDPPDGVIPYTPWARTHQKDNFAKSRISDPLKNPDPVAKCYQPGVPRFMYMGWPVQIIQTGTEVHFISEYAHTWRVATLSNAPRDKEAENFLGISRGRWEGETLVLDTTNLNDVGWLDMSGNFLTKTSHVVERLTRTGPNEIDYEVTIEDPRIFTRPWKMRMTIEKQSQKRLLEYECIDLLEQAGFPPIWDRDWDQPLAIPAR
jgi:hypothetical protein